MRTKSFNLISLIIAFLLLLLTAWQVPEIKEWLTGSKSSDDGICQSFKNEASASLSILEKRTPALSFEKKEDRDFATLIDSLRLIPLLDCNEINTNEKQWRRVVLKAKEKR